MIWGDFYFKNMHGLVINFRKLDRRIEYFFKIFLLMKKM